MKIICSKSDLVKAVNIVSRAVPSKTTMSILECIYIDASAGNINLTANDMELGIETIVKGTIEERGSIALDARIFGEIVRKLPDNDVFIESDEKFNTTIKCEKSVFHIIGRSGEEFSKIPYIEKDNSITMSQFSLKEAVKQTIFSIAESESNKTMSGELFDINENLLKIVSLDGHRISIRYIELRENFSSSKLIIPGKTLQEIMRIIPGDAEKNVDIYYTDNHVLFEFDDTKVMSRLIEGNYFPIDHMISNDYDTKVTVDKKMFLECIERASLLIREGDKKPIIIRISDDVMEMSINSFIGSMKEEIEIEKEGRDLLIGFNPKFFIDALRVIDDEKVSLYMVNPKAPCFIRDDDNTYNYMILPVNVGSAGY